MAKYLELEGLKKYDSKVKKDLTVYIEKLSDETLKADGDYSVGYDIYQGVDDQGHPTKSKIGQIRVPLAEAIKSGELRKDTETKPSKIYLDLFFDEEKTKKISVDLTILDQSTDIASLQKAIEKLNGTVETVGSVLYQIYNQAGAANYGNKEIITGYTSPEGDISISAYAALTQEQKVKYTAKYETRKVTLKEAIEDVSNRLVSNSLLSISTTETSANALKTYTFSQNGTVIGKVDIPKDFLVKSGKITEFTKVGEQYYQDGQSITSLPDGVTDSTLGKYIELTINVAEGTSDNKKIYIYVKDLVDAYTGEVNSIEVSGSNVISVKVSSASDNIITKSSDGIYAKIEAISEEEINALF